MVKKLVLAFIHFYQKAISPLFPRSCRFWPTCSEYALEAINTYGLARGLLKTCFRVLKCNPFHPGGYDPV
jgi:putative membrane protein insertion efficiency factor